MRRYWCGLLVVGVLLSVALASWVDEQEEGLKIAESAIKAVGGAEKVDQLKTLSMKGKGTVTEGGGSITFTFDAIVQGHDLFRLDLEGNDNGMSKKILVIVNGEQGWMKVGEMVQDIPAEILPLILGEQHALRSSQMLTSLKDKALKLSPLGEVKVNDRPALGLKVVRKDRPEVDLFFDKETNLPIQCQLRVKEPNEAQEVTHSWIFSGHKESGGVKHPMKVTLLKDDKKLLEMEVSEVKVEEKVEDSTFAKP